MKVGVEQSLTNVRSLLEQNNYDVVELEPGKNNAKQTQKRLDAIVASGMDSNFLGMQDTMSKTPVITADGRTAEEVVSELKDRLQ